MLDKVNIFISKVHNPAFNLAFESYLLKNNTPDTMIFYLWQNDKTIVIGRHQNPYKECDLEKVKRDNVTVIRRSSGGGAVYHDLGNLNFTFIAGENVYDVDRQCDVIIDALKEFGLNCEVSGRNDMTI
ncbi:MAG TPA: lipoate--protein ligase family protein, partial [Fusibacter sp.]|nr:lipoate--protein ligase family protein [Fusibacter sp.]